MGRLIIGGLELVMGVRKKEKKKKTIEVDGKMKKIGAF